MVINILGRRDKAMAFVNKNGPVLPIQIAKELSTDTMFAGAILSELVNEGKLDVTEHLRVGGSPVYYMKGQERKLEEFIKNLNENDTRMLKILKENGVLVDRECTPLQRVSYRIVKDFAKSLILKKDNGEKEVFWRYYLVDENVAKEQILEIVNKKEPIKQKEIKEEIKILEVKPKAMFKPKLTKEISDEDEVKEFFRQNRINVLDEKVIKKYKDVNYLISFDTSVGNLKYFVKFRDKKKITEGDISLAFNEAGKLPLMFLSKGELTKQARMLIVGDYKGVVFKRL